MFRKNLDIVGDRIYVKHRGGEGFQHCDERYLEKADAERRRILNLIKGVLDDAYLRDAQKAG